MENFQGIIALLGEENVERLKERIVDLIVDRIRDDLEVFDDFVVYPPDYSSLFKSCVYDALENVKTKITDDIQKRIFDEIANFGDKEEE